METESKKELIDCIKTYSNYRNSEEWSEKEKYKWDFVREHTGIFNDLNSLLDKFTKLGSRNFFPFVWKQSMFRHLAIHHESGLKEALFWLFNENEDLEKRVTNFINSISKILLEDPKWKNKDYLGISLLLDATTFLLFLKNPKKCFLYKKLEVLKRFVFHFGLDKPFIDTAHKVHRYVLWQNYITNELLPVLKEHFNPDVDTLDCQDFIYCLVQHNICHWNQIGDKRGYAGNKKQLKYGISEEEDQLRIKHLREQGIKF